jgi:hypothetical protein
MDRYREPAVTRTFRSFREYPIPLYRGDDANECQMGVVRAANTSRDYRQEIDQSESLCESHVDDESSIIPSKPSYVCRLAWGKANRLTVPKPRALSDVVSPITVTHNDRELFGGFLEI